MHQPLWQSAPVEHELPTDPEPFGVRHELPLLELLLLELELEELLPEPDELPLDPWFEPDEPELLPPVTQAPGSALANSLQELIPFANIN